MPSSRGVVTARDSGVLSLWKNCYILLLDIFKARGNDACGQCDG